MCRILGIQADEPIDAAPWIEAFGRRCQDSKEFQGHGWGMSWYLDGSWRRYRSIRPIWDEPIEVPATRMVLVHARSAFRNEGIVVENNMPFLSEDEASLPGSRKALAFAFNGELHGVRLTSPGATGAARLFYLLKRFTTAADGDTLGALSRLDDLISSRSDYVRALNIVASDGHSLFINAHHSEDPEYFTLHTASLPAERGMRFVSSEKISLEKLAPRWETIPNHTTRALAPNCSRSPRTDLLEPAPLSDHAPRDTESKCCS